MAYVDGFVLPVPKAKVEAYRALAEEADAIWREYDALEYHECVADDLPEGKNTSFSRSVELRSDETVVFAWIVFESREQRDEVNAKVMSDRRIAELDPIRCPSMPRDSSTADSNCWCHDEATRAWGLRRRRFFCLTSIRRRENPQFEPL
jgi:uncharacterized protein YbaA (DUF1428 family)